MSEQPHIDDFFRQKLSQREIPYQEKYWAEAERLIEAQQKKKRRGLIWFAFSNLGLGLALLPFTVMALMGGFSPADPAEPLIQEATASVVYTEEACPPEMPGTDVAQEATEPNPQHEVLNPIQGIGPMSSRAKASKEAGQTLVNLSADKTNPEDQAGPILSHQAGQRLQTARNERHPYFVNPLKARKFIRWVSPLAQLNHRFAHNGNQAYSRHYFGVQVEGALYQGWQNRLAEPAGFSLRPQASLYYAYGLTPNLKLRTGLGYVSRGALNSDSTYRTLSFSFGREEENTTISPLAMHGVEVPLLLDVHLKNRHYFSIGLQSQYWLNTRAEVQNQRIANFETPPVEGQKAWGYRQGMARWDVAGQIGYGYYLGRGYMLRVSALYGMRDQTLNTFFLNTTKDRNLQLRIGIAKDLYHW
ncbi:MAG: outer membrane beta-barrel protein [Bacteroidota bacterium]